MPSVPTHYRPVDEDTDDPPPPYTPQAGDSSDYSSTVATPLSTANHVPATAPTYPVMDSSHHSHYSTCSNNNNNNNNYAESFGMPGATTNRPSTATNTTTTTTATTTTTTPAAAAATRPASITMPPPPPPTSYISPLMASPIVPAAPMVPYPTMSSSSSSSVGVGGPPAPFMHGAAAPQQPMWMSPAVGLPQTFHLHQPLTIQPPPLPLPPQFMPATPAQPHQPFSYPAYPALQATYPLGAEVLHGMAVIPSPALTPSSSSSMLPSLVTVYKCRKCGATLPSAEAVCTRLHAGGKGLWGGGGGGSSGSSSGSGTFSPEKIQQTTAAEAVYGEKSARRTEKRFDFSKDVAITNGGGSSSSSNGATAAVTPPAASNGGPSTTTSHNGGSQYPNEKAALAAAYNSAAYGAPTHDPAAIYDLREMSISSPSSSSTMPQPQPQPLSQPSYLGRSKSVQNPMVSAKKLWRDFRKEASQQGSELMGRGADYQQQHAHRIVVSPEGMSFVPGVGNVATMGRPSQYRQQQQQQQQLQNTGYPVPPGTMPAGGMDGLQRHATVHYTPYIPSYPRSGEQLQQQQQSPQWQARPSAPGASYPLPPGPSFR